MRCASALGTAWSCETTPTCTCSGTASERSGTSGKRTAFAPQAHPLPGTAALWPATASTCSRRTGMQGTVPGT
eukprot:12522296-Alexandrium_andersonii.AAC.1